MPKIKLHNDTNCEPRYEPSHSSNMFNDMRNVSSTVDLEQSLLSNNACQMPKNELISITDESVGQLSFCDVEIKGLPGCVHALDDSGTQLGLSLVNPKVIDTLNLPRFGKVAVRGALGDPVCAPLVTLQLRLPGVNEYTGVTCVACEGLNLDLILVADIVTKLNLVRNELSNANVGSETQDMVDVDVTNVTVSDAAAADGRCE